jgi:hypothetical protein
MQPPEFLIKALSEESHAKSFCEGSMLLRSVQYYRMCKGSREDWDEFSVRYKDKEGRDCCSSLANGAFILSMHHGENFKESTHGGSLVKIKNLCSLFKEIHQKLQNILYPVSHGAYFGQVRYTDYINPQALSKIEFYCTSIYKDETSQGIVDNPLIESAFYKDLKFEKEQEVRLCFLFSEEKVGEVFSQSNNFKIRLFKRTLGHYEQICEFDTFREWHESRSKSNCYGDDHWIELHVKVSPQYFSLSP